MSESRPEEVQPSPDGDSRIEQAAEQLRRAMNRRNLLKVALAAPPVMLTLRARPASAQTSGALSGTLSSTPG